MDAQRYNPYSTDKLNLSPKPVSTAEFKTQLDDLTGMDKMLDFEISNAKKQAKYAKNALAIQKKRLACNKKETELIGKISGVQKRQIKEKLFVKSLISYISNCDVETVNTVPKLVPAMEKIN